MGLFHVFFLQRGRGSRYPYFSRFKISIKVFQIFFSSIIGQHSFQILNETVTRNISAMCDLDYMANHIGFQVDPAEPIEHASKYDEVADSGARNGGLSIPLAGSEESVKGGSRKSETSPRAVTPQVHFYFSGGAIIVIKKKASSIKCVSF